MTESPTYADLLAQFEGLLADVPPLPREIAVSDHDTLDALLASTPRAEPAAAQGPFASLFSVPIVIDEGMPPGRVEFRDRDGRPTRTLRRLAGRWFDEDELRAAAERASRISFAAYYRGSPVSGVLAGPLFDGRLQLPGV